MKISFQKKPQAAVLVRKSEKLVRNIHLKLKNVIRSLVSKVDRFQADSIIFF